MSGLWRLLLLRLQIRRWLRDRRSLFFHDFSDIHVAEGSREDFLLDLCRGRRVLHLGFVDSPFTAERVKSKELLHLRLREVAEHVHGLDADEQSIATYTRMTGDTAVGSFDLHSEPSSEDAAGDYDLVVLGEVLEHLINPGLALATLRRICELNPCSQLCVTVPNAFSMPGVMASVSGHEIVHPEHYFYFSPLTLTRILSDAGFEDIRLTLAGPPHLRRLPGLTKPSLIALCRPAASKSGEDAAAV